MTMLDQPAAFRDLVRRRRSCRQFLQQPLGAAEIGTVLQDAQHTPSNCNTQHWQVHIVSGATRASLTQVLLGCAGQAQFSSDFSWDEKAFPGRACHAARAGRYKLRSARLTFIFT